MRSQMQRSGKVLLGAAGMGVIVVAPGLSWMYRGNAPEASAQTHDETPAAQEAIPVRVTKAKSGGLDMTTKQPCTVQAFDYEGLYAKVSGILDKQTKDIGETVKKGEVLAVLWA